MAKTAYAPVKDTWNEADFINPYLSPLRQWICLQLALLVPNSHYVVASNDEKTKEFFKVWTGYTQSDLETKWEAEGFEKSTDLKKSGGRVWFRNGGGPVTTSCEALVNKLIAKIKASGQVKAAKVVKSNFSSFNIPGCGPNGKEPATSPGWHWYRDKTKDVCPQPGDLFQVGTPLKPGQWSYAHVGIITGWVDGDNPTWTTVEGGQGGPGSGYDAIKRNGPRPLNPIDPRKPSKVLMGWLNIEEFFAGEPVPDQSNTTKP